MLTIKVGRRGQITIPSEIRYAIGLQEGHLLAISQEGDQVILRPLTKTLLDLRGSVAVDGAQDFDAIRQKVVAERAGKAGRDDD